MTDHSVDAEDLWLDVAEMDSTIESIKSRMHAQMHMAALRGVQLHPIVNEHLADLYKIAWGRGASAAANYIFTELRKDGNESVH